MSSPSEESRDSNVTFAPAVPAVTSASSWSVSSSPEAVTATEPHAQRPTCHWEEPTIYAAEEKE